MCVHQLLSILYFDSGVTYDLVLHFSNLIHLVFFVLNLSKIKELGPKLKKKVRRTQIELVKVKRSLLLFSVNSISCIVISKCHTYKAIKSSIYEKKDHIYSMQSAYQLPSTDKHQVRRCF